MTIDNFTQQHVTLIFRKATKVNTIKICKTNAITTTIIENKVKKCHSISFLINFF